jgi:hypothetical protein
MRTRRRVLRPLSGGLRYDLAIDNGDGTVVRVQCKTGILRNGFISFRVCNADARRPQGIPYQGQIEAFGVYCPQNARTYLIPSTPSARTFLRRASVWTPRATASNAVSE